MAELGACRQKLTGSREAFDAGLAKLGRCRNLVLDFRKAHPRLPAEKARHLDRVLKAIKEEEAKTRRLRAEAGLKAPPRMITIRDLLRQ